VLRRRREQMSDLMCDGVSQDLLKCRARDDLSPAKRGKLEEAEAGSVFLDEVGELAASHRLIKNLNLRSMPKETRLRSLQAPGLIRPPAAV